MRRRAVPFIKIDEPSSFDLLSRLEYDSRRSPEKY